MEAVFLQNEIKVKSLPPPLSIYIIFIYIIYISCFQNNLFTGLESDKALLFEL